MQLPCISNKVTFFSVTHSPATEPRSTTGRYICRFHKVSILCQSLPLSSLLLLSGGVYSWGNKLRLGFIGVYRLHRLARIPYQPGKDHRPYSRQVTGCMECDVAIHPTPSVYPKAGNGALRGRWAIKYHCKNDSPTMVFTVRDLVHWNYVTSENIPHVCKSWKLFLIYVLATDIFFVHPTLTSLQLTSGKLRSGRKHWSLYELEKRNYNYCHPNMGVGKSNCTDNDLLKNVNMMFQ